MNINLKELLSADPDLTKYEIKPEDKETPAGISVADLKETLLAINVLSRRVHDLLKDLERAEGRINQVERHLSIEAD